MILSGNEIKENIATGSIVIEPYDEKNVNPNSYNVCLGDKLAIYKLSKNRSLLPEEMHNDLSAWLDPLNKNDIHEFDIPDEGMELLPGVLYLASTKEYTETHSHVPLLYGRSSIGRLGIFIHITAGFGDIGFKGRWTLEITVVEPVVIYKGMKIGQIIYHTVDTEGERYSGRYNHAEGLEESKFYKGDMPNE